MATGDSKDMQRMQDDAMKRAREMQKRSKLPPVEEGDAAPKKRTRKPAQPKEIPQQKDTTPAPQPVPVAEQETISEPPPNMLDSLLKDKERTLILTLLILISNEGDNNELLFSLMFLLM